MALFLYGGNWSPFLEDQQTLNQVVMKKSIFIRSRLNIAFSVMLAFGGLMISQISKAEAVPPVISFQVFYDELLPYGDWIRDPVHGYVWVPYAEPNFQPYATNGHWVMSTYGNTWVSNYAWGWAPFHYGRWYFDDYLGWAWVPGYEWGPAWVNWRSNAGYYGWAPLGPGISIHVAVNIPSHHWILSGFTDSHPFELVKLPVDQLEYRDLCLFIIDHKKTLAH